MTDQDSTSQNDDLLKQGIDAARAGDKPHARTLLEQIVEQDQHNEKAWFWLAAVTDDIDEKRVCLGNVLVINPDNSRAKRLLEQLEPDAAPNDRAALIGNTGGVARRTVYIAIGLGIVAVVILIALLAAMLGGGNKDNKNQPPKVTEAALNPPAQTVSNTNTPPPTQVQPSDQTGQDTPEPGTTAPESTTTNTPPPPTWTPVPTFTPIPAIPPTLFPAPPAGLPGEIIMRSGQVPGDPNNQPIVLIKADGSAQRTVTQGTTRGHTPVLSPDGSQYAFIMYAPGTRETLLVLDNIQGTDQRAASRYWTGIPTLQNQEAPTWSPDGRSITFAARGLGAAAEDLFRLSLADPAGNVDALERLTSDDAAESWPAYSPDGTRVVYAADLAKLDFNAPVELRTYDFASGKITNVTNNGADLIEAAPDWSPDGQYIIFQAHAADSSQNDIYRIAASGFGGTEKIIESDANDIQPRYSPDGRYMVFSSDRTGNWDIFIYDFSTQQIYQLTTSPHTDIANDWGK